MTPLSDITRALNAIPATPSERIDMVLSTIRRYRDYLNAQAEAEGSIERKQEAATMEALYRDCLFAAGEENWE